MLTLGGVVEVLVDKLASMSARRSVKANRINAFTNVVGRLAQVTESWDGEGKGTVDIPGQLLGAAVWLGDIGGERGRHVEESFVLCGRLRMSLV
jgi:hypothetical protein